MQVKKIIDITPTVSERLAVFPGDRPFKHRLSMSFEKGHHLALGWIETTVHLGAHADAPSHYDSRGEGIEKRDLGLYLGPATVLRVDLPPGARITPGDVSGPFGERVLFKTSSFPDPDSWNPDFNALSPELVDFLARRGVVLVGIDTPSVDPAGDARLLSHRAIYRNDMAVLEGLALDKAEPGSYVLCALPLKLEKADASPVRAVLWK